MYMTATHQNNHPTPESSNEVFEFDLEEQLYHLYLLLTVRQLLHGPDSVCFPLRTTSFLDIRKHMWNYRSSSRSPIPQDC